MSDDGLFEWAVVWGKRVAALALLTGMAAAVVGAGVFAVGTLLDGGSPAGGVTGGDDRAMPTTTTTTTTTSEPEEGSTGVDDETTSAVTLTVDVQVAESLRSPTRYRTTVNQAVQYWEENAESAGYNVRPVLNRSAEDPDVVVRVTPEVTCEGDPEAVGCAPLVPEPRALEDTVEVRLEPRPNDRLTHRIAVHELGHVFGVEHCAEPREFMYMDCPPAARSGQRDDAAEDSPWRQRPWAESELGDESGTELRVYIDTSGWVPGDRGQATTQVQRALDYYERKASADGVGPVRFTEVDDPYGADIRINFSRRTRMCALPELCSDKFGVSTDADDALERYSYARLELALNDPALVGWRAGYRLGFLLGAEDESDLPPVFRNREAVDPSGDWWTYEDDEG